MFLIEESNMLVTAKDPKSNRLFIDVIREYLVSHHYQVYCTFHCYTKTKIVHDFSTPPGGDFHRKRGVVRVGRWVMHVHMHARLRNAPCACACAHT